MKKNISEFFYQKNRLLLCTIVPALVLIATYWIVPNLTLFFQNGNPVEKLNNSLTTQLQLLALGSIIVFPCWILFCAITLSQFRRLKPETEGGLISDSKESLTAGLICFAMGICGILFQFVMNARGVNDPKLSFADMLPPVNMFLLMCTLVGIILSFFSIAKEFNPKKLPIEKFGIIS